MSLCRFHEVAYPQKRVIVHFKKNIDHTNQTHKSSIIERNKNPKLNAKTFFFWGGGIDYFRVQKTLPFNHFTLDHKMA